MKKTKNNKGYLLGIDKEGNKVYLQVPSWDCGWYWGFGYIQTYRNFTFESHQHFEGLFLNRNIFNSFIEHFKETTLNESEVWKLLELMKSFYILREAADLFNRGGSHITSNPIKEVLKSDEIYRKINEELLPQLFREVEALLT